MSRISATIITYNEQENIERCLCSLLGIVDEVIVVDSFSTDSTVEICERYGCHIARRRFDGYGTQRQYATSLATNPYVLSIDADEVLSEDLRNNLLELKAKGFEHRVYQVRMVNRYFGRDLRHGAEGNEHRIRLFNKRYAMWNAGNVAERVTIPGDVEPALLNGHIVHYRCATVNEFLEKEKRHAMLRATQLSDKYTSIGLLTPLRKAAGAYLSNFFGGNGFLDGRMRHQIAKGHAKASKAAWTEARRIIKTRNS